MREFGDEFLDEILLIEVIASSGVNRSKYYVQIHRTKTSCPVTNYRNCTTPFTCDPILHDKCTCFSKQCQAEMCSTNCFSNGVCNKYLGKCVCFEKYKGKYCQELIPYRFHGSKVLRSHYCGVLRESFVRVLINFYLTIASTLWKVAKYSL